MKQASPRGPAQQGHCFHANDEISSGMAIPLLEVRHLLLVRAVAREGSLARAGLPLPLTPSAISHQLRDAEERLGTPLFEGVGKRMVLTGAGERLLRSAHAVLEELDRAEEEIRRDAARPRGVLRLTTQC